MTYHTLEISWGRGADYAHEASGTGGIFHLVFGVSLIVVADSVHMNVMIGGWCSAAIVRGKEICPFGILLEV